MNKPETQLLYNKSLNAETRRRGLVITEAYFGLAEHIYHIEAGLGSGKDGAYFKVPENAKEYAQCQVLPVTKQL